MGDHVAKSAHDVTLILHIGLHKTASSYVQNVLSARRYDLLREGVLYPTTGAVDDATVRTRDGAQSGHALFTRPGDRLGLVTELLTELPDTVSKVLLSSEDFTLPRRKPTPEQHLSGLSAFGTVKVILVLRRQDMWIESFYKQIVDQYNTSETRSFDEFLRQAGPSLLDFHRRFSAWRDLVGPENFHVLSYDDLPGGAAIYRRMLEIAGVGGSLLDKSASVPVPRYESVRAIDTLGLRILNSYRLKSREARIAAAKSIYSVAPATDIELLTPEIQAGIEAFCAPINERIETEWFKEPVPGFRFGSAPRGTPPTPPTGPEVVDYIDQVISTCEEARQRSEGGAAGNGGSAA
jgi:hypothetical protein